MDPIKKLLEFGMIIVDKPAGPTSFSVSDFIRDRLKLKKTSHFGTLDPQVTGVLPVALGRACKLTGYFLGHDKTYVGIIRVHKESSIEALQKVINEKFIGKISQIPPKKSSVRRAVREREIKKFEILEKSEKDFLFLSKVQGGTYIRKLCSDLGESVGGAHMLELRRIKAGVFDEKQSVTLYDFERAVEEYENGKDKLLREMIIPAEEMIRKNFEFVELDKNILERALTGKPLFREDLEEFPKNEIFAVFSGERFVEIARKCDEGAIFARPEFVLN